MCLSTLPHSVSRMRHWSCPEKLPSSYLTDDDDDYDDLNCLPRSSEAEDVDNVQEHFLDDFSRVDVRLRVLAAWEKRVLTLREARFKKLKSRTVQEDTVGDNVHHEAGEDDSVSWCRRSCRSARSDDSSPSLHKKVSLSPAPSSDHLGAGVSQINFHSSQSPSSSTTAGDTTNKSEACLDYETGPCPLHDHVHVATENRNLSENIWDVGAGGVSRNCYDSSRDRSVTPTDSSSTSENQSTRRDHVTIRDTRQVTRKIHHQEQQLDNKSSYILRNYFLCFLLPLLSSICSFKKQELTRSRKHSIKEPDKGRGLVTTCLTLLLLINPISGLNVDQDTFMDTGFPTSSVLEDKPLCTDGIFRGNININSKDNTTKMSSLQKYWNCSVVEGSISITSAVYAIGDTWRQYSMPNLVEVTDFVLLYRADEIDTLETLFPKLSVIRGHKLVQFYALAIYQMKNMKRVGLSNLTHIMNGGVRIEKNPLLCYVDTVKWNEIVAQKIDRDSHIEIHDNQELNKCADNCPDKCGGWCWSSSHCQRLRVPCPDGTEFRGQEMCYRNTSGEEGRPCHRECIGGCQDSDDAINNPQKCVACNHTRNITSPHVFTCTASCPRPFVAYKNWLCVTREECSQRLVTGMINLAQADQAKVVYKVHNGQCVDKCPNGFKAVKVGEVWECDSCSDCPVTCDGEIINSPESAKKLKSCTHINGDIVINVNQGNIAIVLEENLKDIEEISGSLKIERSHSLVSLHFFKSLKKIKGEHMSKTLSIFENDNLQKLFPENQVLKLGGVPFIHYNPLLCMKEITKFLKKSGVHVKEPHLISPQSNGNEMVCSEEKLNLNVITGGPDLLKLQYKNYMQTIDLLPDIDVNTLLGYHVYYREVSEEQFSNRSITKYDGMDACGGSAWKSIFVDEPQRFTNYDHVNQSDCGSQDKCQVIDENNPAMGSIKAIYSDVFTYIPNCKPYTPYAIYVTTVMEKKLEGAAAGAQSDIVYARTNETNPSPVSQLSASSPSPHSLEISWSPPVKPNGVIDRYYLEISYLKTGNIARDYCNQQKIISDNTIPESPKTTPTPSILDINGSCPVCESCDQESDPEPVAPESKEVISEKAFHDDIINKVFPTMIKVGITDDDIPTLDVLSRRRKRAVNTENKSQNKITDDDDEEKLMRFVRIRSQRTGPVKSLSLENETIDNTDYMGRVLITLPGNMTSVTVNKLRHFTNYEVRVFACQSEMKDKKGVFRACSDEAILNTKTTFKKKADNIVPYSHDVELYTHSGNGSEGIIKWYPPADPNDMIVHYRLSRSPDASSSNAYIKCISLLEIEKTVDEDGREMNVYHLTDDGEYYIRLQAVSLYDEGEWTRFQVCHDEATLLSHPQLFLISVRSSELQ